MGQPATVYVAIHLVPEECPVCHVWHAIPESMETRMKRNGESAYCPNGHSWLFIDDKAARLEKENTALQHRLDIAKQEAAEEFRKRTRLERRIKAGICPCCQRHFTNVERHIKTKHPEQLK